MKIDLELKTGTDKEVVSSLRKIVGLPIGYEQRVELAKRLILDSIKAEGNPASPTPQTTRSSLKHPNVEHINMRSRNTMPYHKPCSIKRWTGCVIKSAQDQMKAASVLVDNHWFAWAHHSFNNTGNLLLMVWPSRLGWPPALSKSHTLLTDWSLEVPPVPSI